MKRDHSPTLEELGLAEPVSLTQPGKISISELQRQSEREIESYQPAAPPASESTMVVDLVAALLSLLLPGAGQMLKGRVFRGLAWLLGLVTGYFVAGAAAMLAFVAGGIVFLICVILHIACIADAITVRVD